MSDLTFVTIGIPFVISLLSGFLWNDGQTTRTLSRMRKIFFGSKTRSLLSSHGIIWSGWILWILLVDINLFSRFVLLSLEELMFVILTINLVLNWHIGPISSATRLKLDLWRIEEKHGRTGEIDHEALRWVIESAINETENGNTSARQMLKSLITRTDPIGLKSSKIEKDLREP